MSPSRPSIAVRAPMIVTARVPRTPVGERLPPLAPPGLSVPSPAVVGAVPTSPVSVYVVTLSMLLVATALAVAALVLVGRSD